MDCEKLVLVDGSGLFFRAFHAYPRLTRPSDGHPTGAVTGFCRMLWSELRARPADYFAVVFDKSRSKARTELYPAYKAHRPAPPDEIRMQIGLVRDAVRAFDVTCVEVDGYEADDILATYARIAHGAMLQTIIVTSDKDMTQIHHDSVTVWCPQKKKELASEDVFGVDALRVPHVQALIGDAVDGIPGVPSIGHKTAAALIEHCGTLNNLLLLASDWSARLPCTLKQRDALLHHADTARLSLALAKLDDSVPVPDMETLRRRRIDFGKLDLFFENLEAVALRQDITAGRTAISHEDSYVKTA